MTVDAVHTRPGLREHLIKAIYESFDGRMYWPNPSNVAEHAADAALTVLADIPSHHDPIHIPDPLLGHQTERSPHARF